MIRVQALGGLRIFVRGEESVTLSKQRLKSGLLVYLAVERSCMREVLIGTFWPEREPERARHVLSQAVYELRKQMGEEWLTIAGDRMTVADTVTVDVVDFADAVRRGQYEAALRLYQGPFLDGCYLAETHEYEEWLDGQRQRLHKLLRRVLTEVSQLPETPAWIELAIEAARKAADRDPTDDEIQHALLQLLVRAGRRTDALRQYERYEAALAEDELEPLENTRELIATIREAADPAEVATVPAAGTPAPVPTAASELRAPGARRRATGAAAIVVAAAVVLPFLIARGSDSSGATEKGAELPQIAVLPFDDRSPDQQLGYLAGAFTDGLIDALSNVQGLEVRSKAAVRYYGGENISQDSLARALDVNIVIEGSVAKSGEQLGVNVQLIDATTGTILQSRDVTSLWGDFLTMRDSLVADVAILLRRAIGQQFELQQRRAETTSQNAWEHYQRAKQIHDDFVAYMLANGVDAARRALDRADSLAELAISDDADWVAPVGLRARLAAQRVQVLIFERRSASPSAIRAALSTALRFAERAIRIDPGVADGYELRGLFRHRLWLTGVIRDTTEIRTTARAVEADLIRAVTIDSARAAAWSTLSELYMVEGRFLEAQRAAQHAYEADRYYSGAVENLYRLGLSAFETGADALTNRVCDEGRRRFPQYQQFVYCALMQLAWSDSIRADVDSAWILVGTLPKLHASSPDSNADAMFRMMAASVIARSGLVDSARNVIARARESGRSSPALLWIEAAARARLGEYDRADSLISEYVAAVRPPHSLVLESRALRPLREEHVRAAKVVERR